MRIAVGLMAYNEAANVAASLRSLLDQQGPRVGMLSVVVVASGCTDDTAARAWEEAAGDSRARILVQPVREGKASAVTAFLRSSESEGADVLVLAGADTRLDPGSLDALVAPFEDAAVGMTGGRPVPVNDPGTFMGGVVQLLWELHHEVALHAPKLGELVAFRPVIAALPPDTAVDEASLESLIRAKGLRLAYAPDAVVRMKGPTTAGEFLAQRRRIHAGHLRLRRRSGYAVATLSPRAALTAVGRLRGRAGVRPFALVAAIVLEAWARALGTWDARVGGCDHRAWEPIPSTKDLSR
jgi:biofilm PGA synthesis N-glycosyltransferase PgaC